MRKVYNIQLEWTLKKLPPNLYHELAHKLFHLITMLYYYETNKSIKLLYMLVVLHQRLPNNNIVQEQYPFCRTNMTWLSNEQLGGRKIIATFYWQIVCISISVFWCDLIKFNFMRQKCMWFPFSLCTNAYLVEDILL